MAIEVKKDRFGGDFKVDEGVEHYAMWVPITLAEKEALVKKGEATKVNPGKLVANFLREWLSAGELSAEDLAKVAGGAGMVAPTNATQFNVRQLEAGALRPSSPVKTLNPRSISASTVMCPW